MMLMIVLFAAAMFIFAAQNFQTATARVNAPLAVAIVVIYLVGFTTGSSLFALQQWPRLFEQKFRVDKWNVCRGGYAATRIGSFVK